MSEHRTDLYNWSRFSKPRVHSSSQRIVKDDDIEHWIKKVEDASTMAAAATFGTKYIAPSQKAKSAVAATVEDVRLHDAAYSEAQDLLQQWVNDKLDLGGDVPEMTEEAWTRKTETEIKREWDQLLGDGSGDTYDAELGVGIGISHRSYKDPYSILKEDDSILVDDVLQKLLDKEVVESHVLDDLGLNDNHKTRRDPRTKMVLRHQQVKQNREKREREKQHKMKELQTKKEAQHQARQIIIKEDQVKAIHKKKEEEAIQREMAKIRKDMEEERKKKNEQILREQREKSEFEQRLQAEMERQKAEERHNKDHMDKKKNYRQRLIMERLKEIELKEAVDNLKLQQRCFSAWYNLVVERHLHVGKAKAMADWKLLLKSFNAWKSYTRAKHIDKEAMLHEAEVKLIQRKQVLADDHYKSKLLRRCLLAWQVYIFHVHHEKNVNSEQYKTKNKMAAFLEAAATGKLWSARSDEGQSSRSPESSPNGGGNTSRQVDEMFDGPGRHVLPPGSARSDSSSVASSGHTDRTSGDRCRTNSDRVPLQSWQLTRKHVQVTKSDLAKVANREKDERTENEQNSSRSKTKKPFIVNNFENRHNNQQKILETQQKQITEQQRLIEEMQYLQKQQLLQQQLTQQQLVQQKLGWTSSGTVPGKVRGMVGTPSGGNVQVDDRTPVTELTIENLEEMEVQENLCGQAGGVNSTIVSSAIEKSTTSAAASGADNKSVVSSTFSKASTNTKHAKFVQSMEERARERARVKQERDEKRRKEEQEKLLALQAEEEAKRQAEQEVKKKRADAYREKKRLEQQKEFEKQQQLDKLKQLTSVAEEHSRLGTMRYRGWLPWKRLVTMMHSNYRKAEDHHQKTMLRTMLRKWHEHVEEDLSKKRALADDMFNYILIRRSFSNWKKVGQYMVIEEEKALRHYNLTLKVKVIRAWANHAVDEKMNMWRKERVAKEHNTKRVVLTAFRAWRRFPRMIKDEQKRQQRLDDMRKKVSSILPDYDTVTKSRTSFEFFS